MSVTGRIKGPALFIGCVTILSLAACGDRKSSGNTATVADPAATRVVPASIVQAALADVPRAPLKQSLYVAYGDSITHGVGASAPAMTYAQRLAKDAGATLRNLAIPGQLTCNIARLQIFANRVAQTTDGANYVTLMEGTNDANLENPGPFEYNFKQCQRASLSWLAVPRANKAVARDGEACGLEGHWQIPASAAEALTSRTKGDRMTCALTSTGKTIYIWYGVEDGNAGTFTYAIDDKPAVSLSTQSPTPLAGRAVTDPRGVFVARVVNVPAGAHRVRFEVTSTTGSVTIWGAGTPPSGGEPNLAPRVFVTGVAHQNADLRGVETAQFDVDARQSAGLLRDDGLDVNFVDVREHVRGTSADMADVLHPNDLGQAQLRNAFAAAISARNTPGKAATSALRPPEADPAR